MTNAYFIYRMTRELVKINAFVAEGLKIDMGSEAMHVLCLAIVSFFAIQAARESVFLYYGTIILWEFVVLPTGCAPAISRPHRLTRKCIRVQQGNAAASGIHNRNANTHAWVCAVCYIRTIHQDFGTNASSLSDMHT